MSLNQCKCGNTWNEGCHDVVIKAYSCKKCDGSFEDALWRLAISFNSDMVPDNFDQRKAELKQAFEKVMDIWSNRCP